MRRHVPAAAFLALLGLAACEGGRRAPWVTYPGFDNHGVYLPLAGTVHEGLACDACHGTAATAGESPGGTGLSFREFTCRGCHLGVHAQAVTDGWHAGVGGYLWSSPSCYGCHRSTITDLQHHQFFPVGTGTKHQNRTCRDCHGVVTTAADRTDLSRLQCVACHSNPAIFPGFGTVHAAVQDYLPAGVTMTPDRCLRCHADAVVHTIAAHVQNGPAVGSTQHPAQCLTCHPRIAATPRNSAGVTWSADWSSGANNCKPCHN